MIDAHIHLDQYPRDKLAKWIEEWQSAGIQGVVAVASDLRSSYSLLEISERFPRFVFPCLGWHPEQRLQSEQELLELLNLIKTERHRLAGIGEIGLPHYTLKQAGERKLSPYVELLTEFVKAARALNLPVNLHAVHGQAELVYGILQREQIEKAQFHWLKAEKKILEKIAAAGYYLSLTPEICYRERDQWIALHTPFEQLLLETDGPWKFSGPFQGKQTTPKFLRQSLTRLAELTNKTHESAKQQIHRNTLALYAQIKMAKKGGK